MYARTYPLGTRVPGAHSCVKYGWRTVPLEVEYVHDGSTSSKGNAMTALGYLAESVLFLIVPLVGDHTARTIFDPFDIRRQSRSSRRFLEGVGVRRLLKPGLACHALHV